MKRAILFCLMLQAFVIIARSQSSHPETNDQIEEAIALLHQREHTRSLELLVSALNRAQQENWADMEFNALNNMGANYWMMGDSHEAIVHYLKAHDIAIHKLDENYEMIVLNNVGIIYFHEGNNAKAEEYFGKAYELAHQLKDSIKIAYYATNMAFLSNGMGELEAGRKYLQEAIPLLGGTPQVHLQARMALAENLMKRGELDEARDLALELLPQTEGRDQNENRVFILEILARIAREKGDLSLAIAYLQQATSHVVLMSNRAKLMELLAEFYQQAGNLSSALVYKDSLIFYNDSLFAERSNELYENNKVKLEMQNYEKELLISAEKLKNQRRIFLAISIAVIIVLGLTIVLLRNNNVKQRQRKLIAELELENERADREIQEKQLREKEALALLEQERLKNELEVRNRKLTTRALQMSTRNELIEEVINNLSNSPEVKKNPAIKSDIQQLRSHLRGDLQAETFFTHFEETNPGFLRRLKEKHPELIPSELRFLAYVYMNLTNKEIASLLNVTYQACRKRKERLSKKLEVDSDSTLYDYVSAI